MRMRLVPFVLALTVVLAACSGSSNADDDAGSDEAPVNDADSGTTAPEGPWTFTDDFDVTHQLDEAPDVIVAEVSVAGALWDLGIQVDATFGQRQLPDGTTDPFGLADPDAIESIGEEYGDVNVERLRLLQPDIIVVPSYLDNQYWGIDEDIVGQVEDTAPVVAITIPDKNLEEMADRVLDLAETLGVDPESEAVTEVQQQFHDAQDGLEAALADKPGLTFMAASGSVDQLYIAVPSGYADLLSYQELGMEIVEPDTDEQYWETLSWEQIDRYEADVILADSRAGTPEQALEQIPEGARDVPAIQAGQLARWEVLLSPGYANLARILNDLTEVVESADPNVV